MASANQQIAGGVAQRLASGDYIIDPDIPHRAGIGRSRQLFAIVLVPIVIFVSVALLSFDPADPPANRGFPPRIEPVNLCGHLGASVSTLIYQSTGVAGWLGVTFLAGLAIGLFRNQRYADLPWRASGAVLSILSFGA